MNLNIKKIVLLLCSMLMVVMCMGGCTDTSTSIDISNPPETKSKYDNLIIKDAKYNKENNLLDFKVENNGDTDINTSLHYKIEKYSEKDGWVKTDLTDNLAFIEIAIIIQPYQTSEEVIDLSQISKLSDGYYRIVKSYYDGENNINGYIQFKFSGDDIIELKAYNQ